MRSLGLSVSRSLGLSGATARRAPAPSPFCCQTLRPESFLCTARWLLQHACTRGPYDSSAHRVQPFSSVAAIAMTASTSSLPLRLWANAHIERRGANQRGFVLDCVGAHGYALALDGRGIAAVVVEGPACAEAQKVISHLFAPPLAAACVSWVFLSSSALDVSREHHTTKSKLRCFQKKHADYPLSSFTADR